MVVLYVILVGQCDESLSTRKDNFFKTNVWWPLNFKKLADFLVTSYTQTVHAQFFSKGFSKSKVYETNPQDLKELKTEIRHYVAAISDYVS